jgi:transposase
MERICSKKSNHKPEVIPLKKRVYRAVAIRKVNIERLKEFTSGKRIIFSVDAAKIDFYGAFYNEDKEIGLTIRWKSPDEVGLLSSLLNMLDTDSIEIVLEPTGTYGDAFREQMEGQGWPVYLVSPKRCHDASEVYDGVPSSHDAKSAAIIGKLHLEGLSKPWPKKSEQQRKLSAALTMAKVHRKQLDDNTNRLEAQLARHWPELPIILSLESASLLGLLSAYGGPQNVLKDQEAAYGLLRRVGRSLSYSKQQEVIKSAIGSIGVPMIPEEEEAIKALAIEIDRNRVSLREYQKKVRQIMDDMGQSAGVKEMSKVVGQVTTAILWVTLGDPASYESSGAYLKAAGLNLKERSSGAYKGSLKITKRGSGQVRQYLYLAVLRLIQSDVLLKKWYAQKIVRDGGKKGKAIVALMRKLIIGLWRVGRDGTPFDTKQLFDETRLLKA